MSQPPPIGTRRLVVINRVTDLQTNSACVGIKTTAVANTSDVFVVLQPRAELDKLRCWPIERQIRVIEFQAGGKALGRWVLLDGLYLPGRGVCRVCGCTDADCPACISLTGQPCNWVEPDLCSACVPQRSAT